MSALESIGTVVACVGLGVLAFTGYGLILIGVGATLYTVGRLTYRAGG